MRAGAAASASKRSSHNANSRRKAKPKHLQRLHHDDNPSSPDRLSDGRRSPGRRDPRISSKGWVEYLDRMPDNEADRKLASGKLLEPGSAAEARALSCRYRREQVKERLKLLEPSEGFGNGNDDADSTVDEFVRSDDGLPGSATSPGPPGAGRLLPSVAAPVPMSTLSPLQPAAASTNEAALQEVIRSGEAQQAKLEQLLEASTAAHNEELRDLKAQMGELKALLQQLVPAAPAPAPEPEPS
jgi:hypothetical protein